MDYSYYGFYPIVINKTFANPVFFLTNFSLAVHNVIKPFVTGTFHVFKFFPYCYTGSINNNCADKILTAVSLKILS